MPRIKAKELRELPEDELLSQIESHKEELFNLRFQLATGQLDNHRRMQQVRRDIARIRTVLRERDFAYAARTAAAPAPATAPQPTPPAPAPAEPEQPEQEEVTS